MPSGALTPVTFVSRSAPPRYRLAVIDPHANLKGQIMSVLEAQGVTCDEILRVMDEVKADRSRLGHYFVMADITP